MKLQSPRLHFQRGRWFHNFIVALDRMESVPAWLWFAIAVLCASAMSKLFGSLQIAAVLIMVPALGVEALALLGSRAPGRSPSPFGGPFFLFLVGHLAAAGLAALMPVSAPFKLGVHAFLQAGLLSAMLYGSLIEPYRVRFRRGEISLGDGRGPVLRLLLVSDLHLDRAGPREEQILAHAREFQPDLVIMPGDFTNLSFVHDETTRRQTRDFISRLARLAPLVASRGTPEVDDPEWVEALLANTGAVFLDDEARAMTIKGVPLFLIGIPSDGDEAGNLRTLARLLSESAGRTTILLHHSPDLIHEAARLGVSLYFAGHTHGGQVRLPLAGALYTASRFGRKYAGGTYREGKTVMIVSRGVGLEGAGAPRLRFLCPPEAAGVIVNTPSSNDG